MTGTVKLNKNKNMFDRDQKRLSLRNVASILEVQRNAGVPAPSAPPLPPPQAPLGL